MGLFTKREDTEASLVGAFADQQEREAILERATDWAEAVICDKGVDRTKEIQVTKAIRDARKDLSLAQAVQLAARVLDREQP